MKIAIKVSSTTAAMAFGLACTAPSAHAQSSVTLYGLIDSGVSYVNSAANSISTAGSHRIAAATGPGTGNRVGFMGSEDLGGGMHAIFTLENGFSSQNGTIGQGGRMFGRQAFVGLATDHYGTLTLGRQYEFAFEYLAPMEAWVQFGSIYGAHIGDVDNTFSTFRPNQVVKYEFTPIAGLTVGGLYAFSNQASNGAGQGFANNRAYGAGANYKNGPLHVVATYLHVNDPSAGVPNGNNSGGTVDEEYNSATTIFYNAGFVQKQTVYTLGVGYQFGALGVNLIASDTRLDYLAGQDLRVDNYEVNAKYSITPAFYVGAGYIFTNGFGYGGSGVNAFADGTHPKWHQVDLGAAYLFSKKTDVHLTVLYQRAAGDATVTALNVLGPAGLNERTQIAVVAGLRVRF
jgi:GBP family porin